MKSILAFGLAVVASVSAALSAGAEGLRFNRIWTSHMVLQRGEPIPFAGFGESGSEVKVLFNGETRTVVVDSNSNWRVTFPAIEGAGGAYEVIATDGTCKIKLEDVTMGDIWLCTGQSNAWWPLGRSGNPEREVAGANDAGIRLLDTPTLGSEIEVDEPPYARGWSRCTSRSARDFSALAFHFARTVREKLGDVPIGLIGSAWPGPPISHFLPPRDGQNTNYLAKSRTALYQAAADFKKADELLDKAYDLFNDNDRLAALAKEYAKAESAEVVALPAKGGLEHTVLKEYRGIAAFTRKVQIPSAWLKHDLTLDLGASSLPGVVFFNGEFVGAVKNWESPIPGEVGMLPWKFTIPAALVKTPDNSLTVFVGCHDELSWWGAFSGQMPLSLKDAPKETLSLAGEGWSCRRIIDIPNKCRTYGGSWGARIAPFFQLPIKGVLFYQGEADAQSKRDCAAYLKDQTRLVECLRERWGNSDLPFYCVQLANHDAKSDQTCGEIREAQRLAAEKIPHFGYACSIDIGHRRDIHPPNKREQGRRLALQALAKTYGCTDVVPDGPEFRELSVKGNAADVVFSQEIILKADSVTGFEVLDAAGAWHPAMKASLNGKSVHLTAPFEIKGVRYLWENFPEPPAALFGATGLPVAPFRHTL